MARVEAELRLGPVWLLWLLIVLALAVALAIFAASWAYRPASTVPTSFEQPITSYLTIADAPQKLPLVGRRVVVKDVPVESVAGGGLFWAGKPGHEVPVLLDDAPAGPLAPQVRIEAGQTVNVTGNVRPASNLSREQFDRLAAHPVYIAAESVTVAER